MSLSYKGFCLLIDSIKDQGYDEETASHYASIIGDTPITDENGKALIIENGKITGRIINPYDSTD